jgi:hypothetical protein
MQIIKVKDTGRDFQYKWPDDTIENYPYWISYQPRSDQGIREVLIAFGTREVFGKERARVIIFVNGFPQVEFFGADDFDYSGDILWEVKILGQTGERICRYPIDPIPERYNIFNIVGLPNRIVAKDVHDAWAVVANVADHKTLIALTALRMEERSR